MDDRLVVDGRAVRFTVRGLLYALLGTLVLLAAAQTFSWIFGPPNLSKMSDYELKTLSKRIDKYLGGKGGVIGARYFGGRSVMNVYPLDGGKSIQIDSAFSMSAGTRYMSRYETAFDYLREEKRPVDLLDRLNVTFQSFAGLFAEEYNPHSVLQMYPSVFDRFVFRLDKFGIERGEKFGLPSDPRGSTHQAIVVPEPEGKAVYICKSDGPLFYEGQGKEIEVLIQSADALPGGVYSDAATEKKFTITLPDLNAALDNIRHVLRPLQGSTLGVYFIFYTVAGQAQSVRQSGVIFCDMTGNRDAEIVSVMDSDAEVDGNPMVSHFWILSYLEKTGETLGVVEDRWEDGYYRILSIYSGRSGELRPLFKVGADSTGGLIDYKKGEYFFFSSMKPEYIRQFPERQLNDQLNEGVAIVDAAGTGDTKYSLCSLNLDSHRLTEIAVTSAIAREFRTRGFGYSSPIFTLSESTGEVIYADGGRLVAISYNGKKSRVIAEEESGNWNMLWSIEAAEFAN